MGLNRREESTSGFARHFSSVSKAAAILLWGALIIVCLIYRDEITVERIVNFTPSEPLAAAAVMLLLYALKSMSLVVYGGILYAASGIMFSLPAAIALNTVGTAIMVTIPFFLGKRMGSSAVEKLAAKNKRMKVLRDFSGKNEFFTSFIVRMVGLLPGDLVSMYMGAAGVRYSRYIAGTMLGLFPAVMNFSVMGMSIHDVSSPEFILSACCEIGLMLLSVLGFALWKRKKRKASKEVES